MEAHVFQQKKALMLPHGFSHHLHDYHRANHAVHVLHSSADHPRLLSHSVMQQRHDNHQPIYQTTAHTTRNLMSSEYGTAISKCDNNDLPIETGSATIPMPGLQCNSGLAQREDTFPSPTKKRKAKHAVEDKGKGKAIETDKSEEGQSEITTKTDRDNSTNTCTKDYIHVRARRGQATDSHSLAERARREKISKKMKFLQELVPGCQKVTGKAGMLDEIINYVQSLQKQVEFLSMKLAALDPRLDFTTDCYLAKEGSQLLHASNSACLLHCCNQMETGNCGSMIQSQKAEIISPERFIDSSSTIPQLQLSGWDSELLNQLFNASFH